MSVYPVNSNVIQFINLKMVLIGAPVIICDYINKIDLNECNMLKMFKFNENDANNCNFIFFLL